jgi:glycerol-3-phosphate dehydrogenase
MEVLPIIEYSSYNIRLKEGYLMTHYDVLIIGSGIVGSAIAFELSKYDLKVLVVEKENDVALGTCRL